MPARNPYELLQVSPSAHATVIEAAYRALMKRHHPDQAGAAGDPALAAAINEAYSVLRDPERRATHDRGTEFERRERATQTRARLAALGGTRQPLARRMNLFGWSGWLVALIVTAVLATVPRPARVAPTGAEVTTSVSGGSQPDPATLDTADEELGRSVPQVPVAPVPPEAVMGVAAVPRASPEKGERAHLAQRTRRATTRRRREPAQRRGADPDFLEREGYIY